MSPRQCKDGGGHRLWGLCECRALQQAAACLPVPGVRSREALGVQVNTYIGPSVEVTVSAGPPWSVEGGLHDRRCEHWVHYVLW